MKEYIIKLEDSGKYNIYYYINGEEWTREFYAPVGMLNQPVSEIRRGYEKHPNSL